MPSCFVGGVEQSVSKPGGESSGDTHRVPQQSLKTVVVSAPRTPLLGTNPAGSVSLLWMGTVSPKFVTVSGFDCRRNSWEENERTKNRRIAVLARLDV